MTSHPARLLIMVISAMDHRQEVEQDSGNLAA
jgi:hypothetical protein